jgi:ribosomal protein L3 glutamine methyltransferase
MIGAAGTSGKRQDSEMTGATAIGTAIEKDSGIDELHTVRDWLRFGVSSFTKAGLVFGHGTSTALDEAAFLILMALHLPIDQLEPWLEARLTKGERRELAELFHRRLTTRKPAAYLVNAAFIQGHRFYVDERVIVPRSYIGELLLSDALSAVIEDADSVGAVLDLCTGSGCLALLAAMAFPDATVDAVDLSPDALAVARKNIEAYGLNDRVTAIESDLFDRVAKGAQYDLIIANPPYVAAAEVAAFDPEYRAEPQMAHLGGADGFDLVRKILGEAGAHLAPDGTLVVEIGTGREALEHEFPHLPFFWLDTELSEGEVFALRAADLKAARLKRPPAKTQPAKRR